MEHSIILADTQAIFRNGAHRVLALEPDLCVIAQCQDLAQLNDAIAGLPEAIILFPSTITDDLQALLDRVDSAQSKAVIVVNEDVVLGDTITRRAAGMLLRSAGGAELVACIRRVALGNRCVSIAREVQVVAADGASERVLHELTPKELQILALVAEGAKNKEIAAQLKTKEQVIKNYLRSIYDKVGVSDRLELALFTLHHADLAAAAAEARENLARGAEAS